MPYLHEPYSALTGLEHDVFVGIGLVILATERVEKLLLVGEVTASIVRRAKSLQVSCLVITPIAWTHAEYLCK